MKYYNLNAKIGMDEAYTSGKEVLKEMDRLGVYTTVAEYTTGSNSLYINQKLLQEIRDLPEDRVIPAYALDVGAVFQIGAMDAIRQMLLERPGCIVLRPKDRQFQLRTIDMALDQLKDMHLIVMMDGVQVNNNGGAADVVFLAEKYPNMAFVYRRIMYSAMPPVVEAMHRAKNVYVECSCLHIRNGISMMCRHFGADRVIFSLGHKGNGGAAMAAVAFSDLSDEEKALVCYGNFERLFGQKLTKEIPNQVRNSFWTPFVEQRIVPNVPIYDVHTHLGPAGSNWYLENCDFQSQIAAFEKDMERFHIRKIVSSCSGRPDLIEGNMDMEAAVGEKTDRFKGYVRFSPHYGERYTEEYMAQRFAGDYYIGLKTLPSYMKIDIRDDRYAPLFRYAHEHKLPVLIHSWGGNYGSPMACAEAAAKWPDAKVILGHSGGNDVGKAESEMLAQDPRFSNVYFEFCGSFVAASSWKQTLEKIDYTRVLFGTDACLHDIAWEMGRLLSEDIEDEKLAAILGGNAMRIYGFTD